MDLKDYEKSGKCCEHRHNTRYYENAGQLFVKNINPFDRNVGDVRKNLTNKRKNEEFIKIFDNKPCKQHNKIPSKVYVNEMLNNYTLNNNNNEQTHFKERDDAYHDTFDGGNQRPHAKPVVSMSANRFNTQHSFYSRDVFKSPRYEYELKFDDYNQHSNRYGESSRNETDGNKQYENNTYPLPNMFNQDFIFKTMQKNARVQRIVRKLVIEREREKQREAWNNYINDLKNKHMYYSTEPSRIIPQFVPGDHNTPEMIDEFHKMRLNWRQSNPCEHLLEDIYGAHECTPLTTHTRYPHNYDNSIPPNVGPCIYNNDCSNYPTASLDYARNWRNRSSGRTTVHSNSVMVDNNRAYGINSIQGIASPYFPVSPCTKKPRDPPESIQTANLPLVNEEDYKEVNVQNVKDGNNIYFPYCTEAKPSAYEGTTAQNQYVMIPLANKSSKRSLHASVPFTQKTTKLDADGSVPEHEYLTKNMNLKVSDKLKDCKNEEVGKSCNMQQPLKYKAGNYADVQNNESFEENFMKVSDNIIKLKAKIHQSEEDTKLKSLATIEEKVDCLMKSMNSIMEDIQARKNTLITKRSAAVSTCKIVTTSRTMLTRHSSDLYTYKSENYLVQNSRSLTISEIVPNELKRYGVFSTSKMENMLIEEIKNSDSAKSDIEDILNLRNDRSCSLQITFDIPTKEISTEVTDSLSRARCKFVKTSLDDQRAMTIAVNTDPLGLLAWLRVSTETMKQILSYVPNLNYHAYLALLPLLLPSRQCAPHYTCNICGASFSQPSQLSTHVKQHNSGKTRDCCVCRHALDLKSARADLFACRHCGQRFTRAYCCELHQQSCARQLGRSCNRTTSHIFLQ